MNKQELIDWLIEYKEKQFKKVDCLNEDGKSVELFEANITEDIVDEVIEMVKEFKEPETLSLEWINNHTDKFVSNWDLRFVSTKDLQNLLVPKQEKVDKAYKEGYDMGKEHGYEKGYSVGVSNNAQKPEFTIYDAHDKIREESTLTDKSFDYYWNCIADGVEIDEPGNLLVPSKRDQLEEAYEDIMSRKEFWFGGKQYKVVEVSKEETVIPAFVADFVTETKDWSLSEVFDDEWLYETHDDVARWLYDNDNDTNRERELMLVTARNGGYEIEQEPRYLVPVFARLHLNKRNDGTFGIGSIPSSFQTQFTEQEIKDFDERYFQFAVPVEEVNADG